MVIPGQPNALIAWWVMFTLPAATSTLLTTPWAMKPRGTAAVPVVLLMDPACIAPITGIEAEAAMAGDMLVRAPIRTSAKQECFMQ